MSNVQPRVERTDLANHDSEMELYDRRCVVRRAYDGVNVRRRNRNNSRHKNQEYRDGGDANPVCTLQSFVNQEFCDSAFVLQRTEV
jgi:hypothetical protein